MFLYECPHHEIYFIIEAVGWVGVVGTCLNGYCTQI